jgi:AraC-like DNA-binding protein
MPSYCEQPVNPSVARSVECGWFLRNDKGIIGRRVAPDGCLDIIYDRQRGLRAIGTMTREQRFDFPKGVCLTGIRFRPGMARSFLGISPAELTDRSMPLEDLWSRRAHELKCWLDDAKSIQDAMAILLDNLPVHGAVPNPVQKAIEALATADGNADLDTVARQASLSPRQFRRRCLEESGLTPKRLCRVLRFRHASRIAVAAARPNWCAIALEAGYFDQAHLIRDFQEITGVTPMAVFSNTRASQSSSIEA